VSDLFRQEDSMTSPLSPYTEQHDQFRKTVRAFAEKELAPHIEEWERAEIFPAHEVFKRAGELGIFAAHYPEDKGGLGGDYWYSVAKSEELPRSGMAGVTMAMLVQGDMATPVIADLGSKEQIEEFLAPALRGEKVAALGVSEPGAGSDVAGIRTWARRDGDDWVINGQKTWITNGTQCDFFTLLVKTQPEAGAHGCTFFLVPAKTKGISVSKKIKKIGNHSSDTAELFFEDVRVPHRYMLGEERMGFMYLMQNFQSERLIAATSAVASGFYALERTMQYGRDRVVMGKPLIKREVWQHKFVDHATKLEAGKALSYKAVAAYNHEHHEQHGQVSMETVKLISMCKIFVGDITSALIDDCVQFHGGMGYVEEGWVGRAFVDQRLLRIGGGASEVMKYYIAKLMGM
jgi:citronellyl-CoA dehydrogenase